MPGLTIFNRKWLLASDDLIYPFFVETTFRAIWIVATTIITCLHTPGVNDHKEINYVTLALIILLADCIFNAFLCASVTWLSSRGSVMQVERRNFLPYLLYVKLSAFIFEVAFFIAVTAFIFSPRKFGTCTGSGVKEFLEATSIVFWVYFSSVILIAVFSYDPTGSAKFWQDIQKDGSCNSDNYFLKSKKMWENRLMVFCCLGVTKTNLPIYKEIATFLACFFKDIDLVPSDALAGLVILSKKHASEKRRLKFLDSLANYGYSNSHNDESIPSWMTVENALHFLRLAKSTYGWRIFFDACNPCRLCVLTSRLRCCNSTGIAGADNCCYCNSAALQKVTGLSSEDLIYVSYHNAIYEPAFFIAIDRVKSCVVICIRGTLSVSDIITDIDGESEKVKTDHCSSVVFHCHRGTLKSALYIHRKLCELKVLESCFAEFQNFNLVITGHSLGGSIASVLSCLLRPQYPDLRCYIYGPLAVFSEVGAKSTYDFIFTVIVGDDMTPRLCVRSCADLQSDVVKCLQECEMQKFKLLLGACSRFLFKKKLFYKEFGNPQKFEEIMKNNMTPNKQAKGPYSSSERLYAPGRILFLEYTIEGVRSFWKTGLHFRRLIVTPRMMRDHQPHRIQKMLESVKTQQGHQQPPTYINRALSISDDLFYKDSNVV